MIELTGAGWEAHVAPEDGAGMAALRFRGQDVLVPAPPGARPPGRFGAFWMIPWVNRLDGGRLGAHRMPINHPEDGTAIHGFSRDQPWQVEQASAASAVLVQQVVAGPYRYHARLEMAVGPQGLVQALRVTNAGAEAMPFGAGWHPWFVRRPGLVLGFAATHRLGHDERCLPIDAAPSRGLAGDAAAYLGLDTHFTGWDGTARLAWPGLALRMTATGALAHGVQVFAPWFLPVLCLEPCSHVPDAANRPALAPLGPMRMLAPGEILAGDVTLSEESSHMPKGEA